MHRLGASNGPIALVLVLGILIGLGAYYLASIHNASTIKTETVTSTSTQEVTSVQTSLSTTTRYSTQTLTSLVTSTTTQYSTQTVTNASTALTSLQNAVNSGFAGTSLAAVQTAITGAIASATSTLATAANLATAQSGINSIMGSGFAAGTDDLASIHNSLSAGFGGISLPAVQSAIAGDITSSTGTIAGDIAASQSAIVGTSAATTLTSLQSAMNAGFGGTSLPAVQSAIADDLNSATSSLATAASLSAAQTTLNTISTNLGTSGTSIQSKLNSIMGPGFVSGVDDLASIRADLNAGFAGTNLAAVKSAILSSLQNNAQISGGSGTCTSNNGNGPAVGCAIVSGLSANAEIVITVTNTANLPSGYHQTLWVCSLTASCGDGTPVIPGPGQFAIPDTSQQALTITAVGTDATIFVGCSSASCASFSLDYSYVVTYPHS